MSTKTVWFRHTCMGQPVKNCDDFKSREEVALTSQNDFGEAQRKVCSAHWMLITEIHASNSTFGNSGNHK